MRGTVGISIPNGLAASLEEVARHYRDHNDVEEARTELLTMWVNDYVMGHPEDFERNDGYEGPRWDGSPHYVYRGSDNE